ncbi:hypothetical protein HWV62_33765 [Athelia sp. TMB]|nr:hypothetical protein HWV62_33765 [Athelia sp. TMB]
MSLVISHLHDLPPCRRVSHSGAHNDEISTAPPAGRFPRQHAWTRRGLKRSSHDSFVLPVSRAKCLPRNRVSDSAGRCAGASLVHSDEAGIEAFRGSPRTHSSSRVSSVCLELRKRLGMDTMRGAPPASTLDVLARMPFCLAIHGHVRSSLGQDVEGNWAGVMGDGYWDGGMSSIFLY